MGISVCSVFFIYWFLCFTFALYLINNQFNAQNLFIQNYYSRKTMFTSILLCLQSDKQGPTQSAQEGYDHYIQVPGVLQLWHPTLPDLRGHPNRHDGTERCRGGGYRGARWRMNNWLTYDHPDAGYQWPFLRITHWTKNDSIYLRSKVCTLEDWRNIRSQSCSGY